MKRRAKFEKPSIRDIVLAYDSSDDTRGATVGEAAKDLKLTKQQVHSARGAIKRMRLSVDSSQTTTTPLNEKDIIVVSRMGVPTVERILRLLKAMQ